MSISVSVKNSVRLGDLEKMSPALVDIGLAAAGLALWDDAVNVAPKPPIDTGLLRGSGTLSVSGKPMPPPAGVENRGAPSADSRKGQLVFGFNTKYAARQHELPSYRSHRVPAINSDSGPQFLRSKIERFHKDYGRVAALAIRGKLSGVRL